MIAIYKRELKSYFQTVVGWLFIAVELALFGLYFYVYNLRYGYPYIRYSLSSAAFIMMIAVPILTMRSFADERHSKTDQLILTAPVSVGKVVIGKYLAMATIYTIDIAVICLAPLLLKIFGTVPMLENYVAIFGYWFYGMATIAIGMFLSSLTESQVIAAVISFAALFLGYMMSSITGFISSEGNIITTILSAYDLYTPLSYFMNGTLDLTRLFYYLSIIVLFNFLTMQSIQKRRWSVSKKAIGTGVFSVVLVVIMIAAVVVANLAVGQIPYTYTSIDATSTQIYSLTDESKEYLKTVDQDVTIYYLGEEDDSAEILELLRRYEDLSDHITLECVDPNVNANFYQTYTDTAPSSGSVIVVSDQRSTVVDANDYFTYEMDYTTYSYEITGFDGEGLITSAIQYVCMDSDTLPTVYEITGHGETLLTDGYSANFTEALSKANINLSDLTLLEVDEVPEDASAVIINGPTTDFSEDDAQKIIDYINGGGHVILNTYIGATDEMTNLESILAAYEISVCDGLISEQDSNRYYQSPLYLLPNIASSDYTSNASSYYIFVPETMAFTYGEDTDDYTYTALLTTSDSAVLKKNYTAMESYGAEDGDETGTYIVALAMETADGGSLVVNGSITLFTDNADQVVSNNNSTYFTDIINTMVDTTGVETTVIDAKEYELSTLTISSGAATVYGFGIMLVIPIVLLLVGIVYWVVRRKK